MNILFKTHIDSLVFTDIDKKGYRIKLRLGLALIVLLMLSMAGIVAAMFVLNMWLALVTILIVPLRDEKVLLNFKRLISLKSIWGRKITERR